MAIGTRAKPEAAYDYAELFSALASDHVGDESDERIRHRQGPDTVGS
jgi:hypothetical protein